jgi:hypothetical protein
MRFSKINTNDTNVFIDECEPTSNIEIFKTNGNKKFHDEKNLIKRASWSPAEQQECGLPPTGKRIDNDHSTNSNRVRMRSKSTRNYQLQQPHQISLIRPVSFNERYERILNQSLVRNRHKKINLLCSHK